MQPLLDISGLQKEYRSHNLLISVRIGSLQLAKGDILGIIGPSGCGKSTILEMFAMALRPEHAERYVFNFGGEGGVYDVQSLWQTQNTNRFSLIRSRHIGCVQQDGSLLPFLDARSNILLPARLKFGSSPKCQENLDKLADRLGIAHVLDHMPQTLSYGERQRTAIARSLVHEPDLVLADEPTSALDPETAANVMRLFNEAAAEFGAALLVVSHDHELLRKANIPVISMSRAKRSDGAHVWELESREVEPARHAQYAPVSVPRAGGIRAAGLVALLASRSFWHDCLLSLCSVLSFAAAITPVLLLVGLRFGIIDHLSQRILRNPNALAINPIGSDKFSEEDLREFAAHPNVAFLVPSTRMLSASVAMTAKNGRRINADLVPTAPGDPLLKHFDLPDADNSLLITQRLANELDFGANEDSLEMTVSRMDGGKLESVQATMPVSGIVPDYGDQQARIYAPLSFLEAVECYRDGFNPASFTGESNCPKRESYAGFRMYAFTLEDVLKLRDYFADRGIEVFTFAGQIENLLALKRALLFVTVIVGGATCLGMALSLASSAVAGVRGKAAAFAQCMLLGFPAAVMPLFPVCQMLIRAFMAASISLLFYFAGACCFDFIWREHLRVNETVCHLTFSNICALYGCALALSLLCCVWASRALLHIQLAEVLRRHA